MALTIDLPHNSDGEVDWNTFGNILTGDLLGQAHCASFLDPLYGSGQRGLIPETNWKYVGTKHNIAILKKRVEGTSLESFMGRGVIDFPVGRIAQCILNIEQMHHWERYLTDIRCIKRLSEDNGDTIVYRRYQATACLMDVEADFVYYFRSKFHGEQFVQSAASVSDTFCPPTPGVFRGKILPGSGYVLEPYLGDTNRTLVTYMAAISISGVPAIAIEKVIKDLSVSTHYLNKYMKRVWTLPFYRTDVGSAHMSKPENGEGKSDIEDFETLNENDIAIQAFMHSSSENESKSHKIQESRSFRDMHQVPDHLFRDGEVDWDVLGQEITRRTLQEVERFATVDVKYGSGITAPQHTTHWRFAYEKHNVIVYTKKKDNSTIDCFLGRGVVDAPMKVVSDFLQDIQSTFSWDNTVTFILLVPSLKACLNYETTKCMIHKIMDNLCFVRCIFTDGKFVMSAISVEHPDCPSPPDTTRVKVYSGSGWIMEPYRGSETQTLVTYLAHVDLMGLPSVIANYVLRSYPLAVHYVRLHLPPPPHDTAATSYCPNTGAAVGNSEPIALLSDIGQRLNKGWSISGWINTAWSSL